MWTYQPYNYYNTQSCNLKVQTKSLNISDLYLNVRPRGLKSGFILLWIEIRVVTWRKSPEYIGADLKEREGILLMENEKYTGIQQVNK